MRLHERAMAFLQSSDGKQMVKQRLSTYRMPLNLRDDLVQETMIRVLRAEARAVEPDNPEAFVTTLFQRAAQDLLRGRLRRPEGHLAAPPDREGGWEFADDDVDLGELFPEAERLAELGDRVEATRSRLADRLGVKAHPAAGALAVLAIVHGDATPAADCPEPVGGVAAEEGVWWAGVFYGGPDGCFTTDGSAEDAALRKRRSRALQATKAVMKEAVDG